MHEKRKKQNKLFVLSVEGQQGRMQLTNVSRLRTGAEIIGFIGVLPNGHCCRLGYESYDVRFAHHAICIVRSHWWVHVPNAKGCC